MKVFLALVAVVFLLGGCTTPYGGNFGIEGFGGAEHKALGDNRFQVSAGTNVYTKPEVTQEFAMLKSAQVTLENGKQYFRILDSKSERRSLYPVAPGSMTLVEMTIVIGAPTDTLEEPAAWTDAQEVYDELAPKHLDKDEG